MDKITSKRWTNWAKCKYINYGSGTDELRVILEKLGKYTVYDIWAAARAVWG